MIETITNGKLFIMCGAPGSGKSTWVKEHLPDGAAIVSRDEIRFALVSEDEDYFAHEKEVFNEFCNQIDAAIRSGTDVFADATHLNAASRNKLLRNLKNKPAEICAIQICTPLNVCLERNEQRMGTRAYVPPSAIRRMHYSMTQPDFVEGIDRLYIVKAGRPISIIEPAK